MLRSLVNLWRKATYRTNERGATPRYREGMTALKGRRPDRINPSSPL